jgi:peptidoglycan hydrolase-like protein with peptidoglycan-binding domain
MADITNLDIQKVLKSGGYYDGDLDGLAGPKTSAAVVEFQKAKGLPETGKVDPKTLAALFPKAETKPRTIVASLQDYILNYLNSKIVWAAGLLAAAVIGWVSTRFGIQVPPDVEQWITSGIVTVGTLIIAVLRGQGKDTPRVTSIQPAIVKRPAETVGVEKK